MNIDYTSLSDEELQDIIKGTPRPPKITSVVGDNCGNALACYLNEGPLKDTGDTLPRGGIGPGDLESLGKKRGAPVFKKENLSLDALTPGTIIHMTRQPGDKNYEYGTTHIGIVDIDEQGTPVFRSFTAGKGWRAEKVDQKFIEGLPTRVVATNPLSGDFEQRAEKIAAKVPLDYSKLTDEELQQIANQEVDYSKLSDEELKAIVGVREEAPVVVGQPPDEPIGDSGLPEADFAMAPDPIKTAIGGATTMGLKGVATVLGLPHEYITKPLVEKPLDYLLQKVGVPATQETPLDTMLRPGEFGQVGGEPAEGSIEAPLRGLAVTGAGLVADLPVYGGLAKLGKTLIGGAKLRRMANEPIPEPGGSTGPSIDSQLREGVLKTYTDKSYPDVPLSEKLTPLATEKYVSTLNRENEAAIALMNTPLISTEKYLKSIRLKNQSEIERSLVGTKFEGIPEEAAIIAEQQAFKESFKDINKWYESAKERYGAELADKMRRAYIEELRKSSRPMYSGGPSTEEIKAFARNAMEEGAPLLAVVGQVANKFKITPEAAMSALRGGLKTTEVTPALGATGKVGLGAKSPLDLGEPVNDIEPRVLGEFSIETKPFQFDRIERVLPGAKDTIYWKHKLNEKTGLEEVHKFEAESRAMERVLPKGSSEAIMLNAIARQKGGPEVLKAMGVTNIPKLMSEQEAALGHLRDIFDSLFVRFNEARAAAGKKPIDKVENYFTFFRRLDEARKENINILTESKEFFNPRVNDLDFAKKRARSDLALVTDAFKVFRNYVREVVPWIHQAPHLKEVSDLSRSLLGKAPNLSYALGRWVNNIQGIDIPRRLGKLDAPVRKLINNVSVATLGGYVRSALAQPASLVGSMGELGPKYLVQGIMESIVPNRVKFALEKSSVLKTREFDVSIVDAMERMIGDTLVGRIKRGATAASYLPLRALDAQAARATWLGAYKRATNKGFDNPVRYADEVVLKTQGSAASSDISDIQTHALGKFITQFQTFVINDFNYVAKELLGISNPDITKREQLRKVINYVLAGTLVNTIADEAGIPTPIPSPLKAMRTAREEGKEGLDVIGVGVAELAQKLPVIGGAARFGGSLGGPMINFAERALRGQDALPIVGAKLAGIPGTSQAQKLLPMLVGDEESNFENWRAALGGKTQERYEMERGRRDLSPEKRFMRGLREPIDMTIEELLQLVD